MNENEVKSLIDAGNRIVMDLNLFLRKTHIWDVEYGFDQSGKLWLFQSRPFIGSSELGNTAALRELDK